MWTYMLYYFHRGKGFRKEYAALGEMRGLLSTDVNIMALTATATKDTRKSTFKSLGLLNPVMIIKSPEKSNIIYKVIQKTTSMEEIFYSTSRRASLKPTEHHKNSHIFQYTWRH